MKNIFGFHGSRYRALLVLLLNERIRVVTRSTELVFSVRQVSVNLEGQSSSEFLDEPMNPNVIRAISCGCAELLCDGFVYPL